MKMAGGTVISAAVEGIVDEAVVRKLIAHADATPGDVYGKQGKSFLRQKIAGYNNAAQRMPWIILVDLDSDDDCAPPLRNAWLPQPAPYLCFRVAIREVEAWLLADAERLAGFLTVALSRLPPDPERLDDPKTTMVSLARASRRRDIREDMVPRPESARGAGPAYASRLSEFVSSCWRPAVAAYRLPETPREARMIPKDCRRLAEVDFPIAEVSRHAAREKSIRHGHPSTLHLWWARRPLASSRAVLLALLWPDPCDRLCPAEFKEQARKLLPQVGGCNPGTRDEDLRKALLKFIADFANWDLAANRTYLEVSRALVRAAHGGEPPMVVDPFAGGGSIPLEALRLGCEAFASDLNPVACLILKVMLEDIPRHGPKLAEDLRRVGAEIKQQAEKELGDLYPKDPDGATPIAYLWARTVHCEAPNCGAEIPLMRSFWLCKKASRKRALKHRVVRLTGEVPCVELDVFEPKAEMNVHGGTVTRAKATCLACGAVLPPERVRTQLTAQRGGADVVFDTQG